MTAWSPAGGYCSLCLLYTGELLWKKESTLLDGTDSVLVTGAATTVSVVTVADGRGTSAAATMSVVIVVDGVGTSVAATVSVLVVAAGWGTAAAAANIW